MSRVLSRLSSDRVPAPRAGLPTFQALTAETIRMPGRIQNHRSRARKKKSALCGGPLSLAVTMVERGSPRGVRAAPRPMA